MSDDRSALTSVQPTSHAQSTAWRSGGAPEPEQIGRDLWQLPMQMPGSLRYSYATVHFGTDEITILDPGWSGNENLARLESFVSSHGRKLSEVRTVLLTHDHPDHAGLTQELRRRYGTRVLAHPLEVQGHHLPHAAELDNMLRGWGVPPERADALTSELKGAQEGHTPSRVDGWIEDGQLIRLGSCRWVALHTPGHTNGHLCFVDERSQRVFTGDHILPDIYPGITAFGVHRNAIETYLTSLESLVAYDDFEAAPGHGYRFAPLGVRRAETELHVRRRTEEVADAVSRAPRSSAYEIAAQLTWTGGWSQLEASIMLYSALRQVISYAEFTGLNSLNAQSEY